MKYFIENEYLKVGINSFGGSLVSIYDKENDEELLYQPLPNSWQGQDVVIFPFVGRLKNKEYTVDNKKYSMENHGLLRYDELNIILEEKDHIVLGYRSSEKTLLKYPFEFIFNVEYKLFNKSLEVKYKVHNPSDNNIYYGIGGHPAFICDGELDEFEFNISGNKVIIEGGKLNKVILNDAGTFIKDIIPFNVKEYSLSKNLFVKEKTIILNSEELNKISLIRKNGMIIEVEMFDNEYVAIWSDEEYGNYCALEPWWSLPDFENGPLELKEKKTIICQEKMSTKEYKYQINIK